MHTHLSLSEKYHYFAAMISRYAEISFPFSQSYIQCFQKFIKNAQCSSFKQDYKCRRTSFGGNGVCLHLVVCPQKPRSLPHRPRSLSEFTETGRHHSGRDRESRDHRVATGGWTGLENTRHSPKILPSSLIAHNHY